MILCVDTEHRDYNFKKKKKTERLQSSDSTDRNITILTLRKKLVVNQRGKKEKEGSQRDFGPILYPETL